MTQVISRVEPWSKVVYLTPDFTRGEVIFIITPPILKEDLVMSEENLYTFENEQYRRTYWHTCSHVLAQAVKRLYPEVKLAIGPSIDTGFY